MGATDVLYVMPMVQNTASACLLDFNPPTFSGISGLTQQFDGSLDASWSAAVDPSAPISYDVFVSLVPGAVNVFQNSNYVGTTRNLNQRIYLDGTGQPLEAATNYYVGVRARDGSGNLESNTVVMSQVSLGINQTPISLADIPQIAKAVWDRMRNVSALPGSFGEALQGVLSASRATLLDNLSRLDVVVSTRVDALTGAAISGIVTDINAKLTNARAENLDKLDVVVSTRASQATVLNQAQVGAAVWAEPLAGYVTAGTAGKVLSDAAIGGGGGGPSAATIAAAVWNSLKASFTTPGSFGAMFDQAISSRASSAEIAAIAGAGFVATDSLHDIKQAFSTISGGGGGDATLANQNLILSALASLATQASVNTLQSSVGAIPTNPLLTSDARLNNLDATISSRLSAAQFDVIKGGSFNPATDSLEAIRDAVSASVDLAPVMAQFTLIKGSGFDGGTDSLESIRNRVEDAKTSADAAAVAAGTAASAAAGAASSAQAATIIAGVAAIPTNTVLATDPRLANLDAAISSRAAAAVLAQAMGGTFNPATDSLENIFNALSAISSGDATAANQLAILAAITGTASQASVNAVQAAVNGIPTNPLLTNDVRLNRIDVAISTRASDADVQAIKGSGFVSTDSLANIKAAIGTASVDLTPILTQLALIKGSGFNPSADALDALNATAIAERAQIKADTDALLAQGEGL